MFKKPFFFMSTSNCSIVKASHEFQGVNLFYWWFLTAKARDWSIIIFLAVPVFIVIFIEKIQQLDNSGPSCDLSQRTAARRRVFGPLGDRSTIIGSEWGVTDITVYASIGHSLWQDILLIHELQNCCKGKQQLGQPCDTQLTQSNIDILKRAF